LKGCKFGRLTVIEQITKAPRYYQKCLCDCGAITTVAKGKLLGGLTVSCGCKRKERKVIAEGAVFGRLTVTSFIKMDNKKGALYQCICSCGKSKIVPYVYLRSGSTLSCGCLHKDIVKNTNATHGMSKTYTYRKWRAMFNRVRNPHEKRNKCYINVDICERWGDYVNFLSDMGECQKGYSLDRIDSTKGYSPENCRWIPLAQQATNTSRNIICLIDGIEACVSEHARRIGIDCDVVFDRINKLKWPIEKALLTPKREIKNNSAPRQGAETY